MFNNIGRKIKVFAEIIFYIEVIAAILAGLVGIIEAVVVSKDPADILYGLIIVIGGFLAAWISSWFIYAFGEIVDKLTEIERNTRANSNEAPVHKKVDHEKIKEYENMRIEGLITEEEFQQAILKLIQ